MLFTSITFAIFLPIVFLLYWFVFDYAMRGCKRQLLWQNLLIVVASYVFYGWWDWRFLILIAITTVLSFLSGIGIEKAPTQRGKNAVMIANVVVNLGILGVYKYYDFFATQFAQLFGIESDFLLLHLILPVGISFYTFQALSYSIDVYRKQIAPCHDIVAFTAFLSFFPQLVAGPIERATNLLPQFQKKRTFDYAQAVDGMPQILWGLFKKIVIADNCGTYVDTVWGDYASHSASTLMLASILFAFQIYGDFSGYSDIAIGTAKLFGIKLMQNFRTPYFARNIADFWRRWHISLTSWLTTYIFIPLSIRWRDLDKWGVVMAIMLTFAISGLWHGANWTFILWGIYHGLLFVPLIITKSTNKYNKANYKLSDIPKMLLTFLLVVLGLIIFRAPSLNACGEYMIGICDMSLFTWPMVENVVQLVATILAIIVMMVMEWRNQLPNRWWIYYLLIIAIWWFAGQDMDFIYFQF